MCINRYSMPLIDNPAHKTYKHETEFMGLLHNMLEIVETIKDDHRLKDKEYLDLMVSFQMLHKLKSRLQSQPVYMNLRERTSRTEPPPQLRRSENKILCNECGRSFTTKRGLFLHKKRRICADTNVYTMYCNKKIREGSSPDLDLNNEEQKKDFVEYWNSIVEPTLE